MPRKQKDVVKPASRPEVLKTISSSARRDVAEASATAVASYARKMGVKVGDVPSETKTLINRAVSESMANRILEAIEQDADVAARERVTKGLDPLALLSDRMRTAKQGIGALSTNTQVDGIFRDMAKLLWKKFDALKNAGFTEDQAFEILLTETGSRSRK